MTLTPRVVIPQAVQTTQRSLRGTVTVAVCICGRLRVETPEPLLLLPLACDRSSCRRLHRKFTQAQN